MDFRKLSDPLFRVQSVDFSSDEENKREFEQESNEENNDKMVELQKRFLHTLKLCFLSNLKLTTSVEIQKYYLNTALKIILKNKKMDKKEFLRKFLSKISCFHSSENIFNHQFSKEETSILFSNPDFFPFIRTVADKINNR